MGRSGVKNGLGRGTGKRAKPLLLCQVPTSATQPRETFRFGPRRLQQKHARGRPTLAPPPAALGPYAPSSKPSPRGPRLILAGSSAPLPLCRESPPTLPASAPTWELPARLPSPRALFPAATFLHVHVRCLLIPRNSSSSKPLLPASQEAGVASFFLSSPFWRGTLSPLRTYLSFVEVAPYSKPALPPRTIDAALLRTVTFPVSPTPLRVFHMFHGLHVNSLPGFHPPLQNPQPSFPAPRPNTEAPGCILSLPPSFTLRISSQA